MFCFDFVKKIISGKNLINEFRTNRNIKSLIRDTLELSMGIEIERDDLSNFFFKGTAGNNLNDFFETGK